MLSSFFSVLIPARLEFTLGSHLRRRDRLRSLLGRSDRHIPLRIPRRGYVRGLLPSWA